MTYNLGLFCIGLLCLIAVSYVVTILLEGDSNGMASVHMPVWLWCYTPGNFSVGSYGFLVWRARV